MQDVQLALRTSIRQLRVARISARALTDPNYGSLLVSRNQSYAPSDQNNTPAAVGPGGVAFEGGARGEARSEEEEDAGWDMRASRLPSSSSGGGPAAAAAGGGRMSVAALELERDALQELVAALEGGGGSDDGSK